MSTTTKWVRGNPLPDEYWIKNNGNKEDMKFLLRKLSHANNNLTGITLFYQINKSGLAMRAIDAKPGDNLPIISYQDCLDTLNGVVQQGYKVGDWVYVLYDHSHGSKNKAGDVKQIVQEKKDCYLAGCCQLAYAVGGESACYELPKNIRPATEEEIAQAQGTPLPTESKEWVPKVGEWVVPIVDVDTNSYVLGRANRKKGIAYQIKGFNSNSSGKYATTKPDSEGCMLLTDIRAATPEEIRKAEGKPDKQYICTSEDGVLLYDGDHPTWVLTLPSTTVYEIASPCQIRVAHLKDIQKGTWKVFSTKAAAEAWIKVQNNLQQIPVTKENARVGMKVVAGSKFKSIYNDQDTRNGGTGIGEIIMLKGQSYGNIRVKWIGGLEWDYYMHDLYIAPGESSTSKSIINSQTKIKSNDNENTKQKDRHSAIYVRTDHQVISKPERRTATPVSGGGCTGLIKGAHKVHRKAVSC